MKLKSTVLRRLAVVVAAMAMTLALAATAQADDYVALGDSYAAGTGSGGTTLNAGCTRTTNAWPYKAAAQRAGTNLTFVACGGAVTGDVINNQVGSITAATDTVTIQIGGNDIGFANIILSCTTLGCSSAISNAKAKIANELPAKLDATYSAIRARNPVANVTAVGYPRMFGSRTCLSATGVSSSEMTAANQLADQLSAAIASRAAAHGFNYADARGPFAGHDVCSSSKWINGFTFGVSSYHPNANGHALGYVPLVRSFIG